MKKFILFFVFTGSFLLLWGQEPVIRPVKKGNRPTSTQTSNDANNPGDPTRPGDTNRKDTIDFEHRVDDTLHLTFRYLDSTRRNTLDSSIKNIDDYYPVPMSWQNLGNNGAASYPLLFKANDAPGFDAGFHAFDIYKFKLEDTKIYKTNRPFSTLGYQLASGKEQMIMAMHTQSPRPNINFGIDYRLISAPGFFVTSNNNHNAYRLFGNYQSKRKRYNGTLVLMGSSIKASQNGGIVNDSQLLDPNRKERFAVDVNLGNAGKFNPNPFNTSVKTGTIDKSFTFFIRQSYDIGKRDSIAINDSTTEYLFYPKLRFQHTFTYSNEQYHYGDVGADSILYKQWFNINLRDSTDTFSVYEKWSVMNNDFSLVQFPDTKNTSQFFLAGITLQNITRTFNSGQNHFFNMQLHGEYRNRTRNKKWDMLLKGTFYTGGLNIGDYSAYASLGRYLNKRWGDVELFFKNVNRTPSFVFDSRSAYNFGNTNDFKKENIISFGATANNPYVRLSVTNYLINNYAYFENYYKSAQYNKPINILQLGASTTIKVYRHWNWYVEGMLQQTDAAAPIRVPLIYTRQRLAYEGRFYKNLLISTGIEARYYTAFKAYAYAPVTEQFVVQDTTTIKNLPDISAYLHFRIKGFGAYIRLENLNTASFQNGSLQFINNNFAAPLYPTPGLVFRFGIKWWFLN